MYNTSYTYPYYNQTSHPSYGYKDGAAYPTTYQNQGDDRIFGAFAAPFLLGGLAGAAVAPYFYRPYPYYAPYPYYSPYPYYPRYY